MNENLKITSKLLEDFNNFVDNRSTVFLIVLDEIFPRILEWHFAIWKKEYESLSQEEKLHEYSNYSEISRTLDAILQKIEERTLKERHSFSFFKKFKEHAENHKKEFISGWRYIESLMDIFYQTFFEKIHSSPEKYAIWEHYFPAEWKITKDKLEDKNNIIVWKSLNNFLQWAQDKIWKSNKEKEIDINLNEVASEIFPSVEPILWAKILTLLMRPWMDNNRMKSLVEQGTNFGFASRIMVRDYESTEQSLEKSFERLHEHMKSQEDTTLQLTLYLFKREFTTEKLQGFIADLKKLKYTDESREEARRKEFISIFEKMLSLLEPKKE